MGGNIVENLLNKNYRILTNKEVEHLSSKISSRISNFVMKLYIVSNCELLANCIDTVDNLERLVYGENGILEAESLPKYFFDFYGRPRFQKVV